jgi:hypothetical protein
VERQEQGKDARHPWVVVPSYTITEGGPAPYSVWATKRKCNVAKLDKCKHKSSHSLIMQVSEVNGLETSAPDAGRSMTQHAKPTMSPSNGTITQMHNTLMESSKHIREPIKAGFPSSFQVLSDYNVGMLNFNPIIPLLSA